MFKRRLADYLRVTYTQKQRADCNPNQKFPSAQLGDGFGYRYHTHWARRMSPWPLIRPSRTTTMSTFKTKNLYHLRISANSVLPLYVGGFYSLLHGSDPDPLRCISIQDTSTGWPIPPSNTCFLTCDHCTLLFEEFWEVR